MTLYDLFQWVIFYSAVGAFFYIPIWSCLVTDTDWGWDHKVMAFFVAYAIPAAVVAAGLGIVNVGIWFINWSKTVVLW